MLQHPSTGFGVSIQRHNVTLDALTEWIEGCITFDVDELSKIDLVDHLMEEQIYREQDFAIARLDDAWIELARRAECLAAASPYEVRNQTIRRLRQWQRVPDYAFCLMLSLQVLYRSKIGASAFGDYVRQGALFERLTHECLQGSGWKASLVGWSKIASESFKDKIGDLARHLGEAVVAHGQERWADNQQKDGGLDVVCHLPFRDNWSGRPVYFVQCASGADWKDKRHTPSLRLWEKLLDLATKPTRGIAIPFALLQDDFRKSVSCDELNLMLDRHRLCAASLVTSKKPWPSRELANDLKAWTKQRLKVLLMQRAN